MLTSGFFSHSSSSLKDISQHMMTGKDKKFFRNESCSIPTNPIGFSDPLVTHHSSEEHSSCSSRVLYDLRNMMVLSDTPSGFCASPSLGRGRGGSMSGRDRGRRSNMDKAKNKALLDCAAVTQLMIHKVLRENDP